MSFGILKIINESHISIDNQSVAIEDIQSVKFRKKEHKSEGRIVTILGSLVFITGILIINNSSNDSFEVGTILGGSFLMSGGTIATSIGLIAFCTRRNHHARNWSFNATP